MRREGTVTALIGYSILLAPGIVSRTRKDVLIKRRERRGERSVIKCRCAREDKMKYVIRCFMPPGKPVCTWRSKSDKCATRRKEKWSVLNVSRCVDEEWRASEAGVPLLLHLEYFRVNKTIK